MKVLWLALFILAQAPSESSQPVATVKQLIVDIVYPAANDIRMAPRLHDGRGSEGLLDLPARSRD